MSKEVFYRSPQHVAARIRQLKAMAASFIVRQSNYTTVIEFPTGAKEMYLYQLRGLDVFKANKVIAKEAVPKYIEADFEGGCHYFVIDADKVYCLKASPEPVYNLDLRAAYPTVLKNMGLITDKTYKYLMRLGKEDRLAAIGMFASRKTVFTVKAGELMNLEEVESEWKNIFFLPAYVTDEIMRGCMRLLGEDFIYYWFDGIYYTGRHRTAELEELVRGTYGMEYKVHHLEKFKLVDRGMVVDISFTEPGKGDKAFSLPKREKIMTDRKLIEDVF